MSGLFVRYFRIVAAFIQTLDSSFPVTLTLLALVLTPIFLLQCSGMVEDGFLAIIRSVCRIG